MKSNSQTIKKANEEKQLKNELKTLLDSKDESKSNFDGSAELNSDVSNFIEKRYRLMGKRSLVDEDESNEDDESDELMEKRYRLMGKRYRLMGKRYRLMGKRNFEDDDDEEAMEKRYRLMGKRYRLMGRNNNDEVKRYRIYGK